MITNKRAQAFQSSLSEFVLFISFIFFLITAISINKYNELEKEAKHSIVTKKELTDLKKQVEELSLKLQLKDKYSEYDYLSELNQVVEDKIDTEDDWQTIKQSVALLKKSNLTSEDIENINQIAKNNDIKEIHRIFEENSALKNELKKITSQAELLRKRSGLDHPSCLISNNGNIGYLMTITLQNNTFILSNKTKEAFKFFSDKKIFNPKEFIHFANIALNSSKAQSLECRYYVRVIDTTTDKRLYKLRLSQVENSFYKYLSN